MSYFADVFRRTLPLGASRWQAMVQFSRMRTFGIGVGFRSIREYGQPCEYKMAIHLLGFALSCGVELTRDALLALADPMTAPAAPAGVRLGEWVVTWEERCYTARQGDVCRCAVTAASICWLISHDATADEYAALLALREAER